jgi:hypothetical protein
MRTRRIAIALVGAALAAGCGGGDDTAAQTATPSASAEATATAIEDDAVARMDEVPSGTATSLPAPQSAKVHDAGLLHDAFASAESMWNQEFSSAGVRYQHAKLAFFHDTVQTPCGLQSRETGPFYCSPSLGVYLNTRFFDALARQYGLSSGFAAGYITAHEVAITSSSCSASSSASPPPTTATRTAPTPARSRWSCRPTATPASGCTASRRAASSRRRT